MISIIMPVKNTEPYLHECIDSIINQTIRDWELIAVDDGSTDKSFEILNEYSKKDVRIKALKNNGSGIIAALQTGYEKAQGEYITRMDSDDINEPVKYERMLAQLQSSGKGHVALGQVKYFSAEGIKDGFQNYENWLNGLIAKGNCFNEIYKECVIPSPCWILYREDFERIGGFETSIYPEDYDLCFRMYKHGLEPIPCNEILFNWRDYPDRTSRTDDTYAEEELLKIKCRYFLEIDFDKSKNLVVWGAGRRGKFIANYLIENGTPFSWVCNNEKKIGKDIYGVTLQSLEDLDNLENMQIVISVANTEEQLAIRTLCESEDWERYFFC